MYVGWRELCRIVRHLGSGNQIDAAMILARADFVNVHFFSDKMEDQSVERVSIVGGSKSYLSPSPPRMPS